MTQQFSGHRSTITKEIQWHSGRITRGRQMKTLLLAAFAALPILTGVAVAADMAPAAAYKAPPPPAPAASWTGCNINAGYGYGMYNTDSSLETFPGLVPTAIE